MPAWSAGYSAAADTIQVTNDLTGTVTWRNTNEYVLNGFIYVLTNGALNIEPGTVIRGKAGTGSQLRRSLHHPRRENLRQRHSGQTDHLHRRKPTT